MNSSTAFILISLVLFAVLYPGLAGAQGTDENRTITELSGTTGANATERQALSNASALRTGTTDVTQIADLEEIFTTNQSVNINISDILAAGEDTWIVVANEGIAPINMTGWTLNANNTTVYTFPAFDLEDGTFIRLHEGEGTSAGADLYTGGALPDQGVLMLYNPQGDLVSSYTYPVIRQAQTQPVAVTPLDRYRGQIQI